MSATYVKKRVRIVHDDNPMSPRYHSDSMGHLAVWHKDFSIGDNEILENYQNEGHLLSVILSGIGQPSDMADEEWEELLELVCECDIDAMNRALELVQKRYIIWPLSLRDYSNYVRLEKRDAFYSKYGRRDVHGFMYLSDEDALKEYDSYDYIERAENYIQGELNEYNMYLEGDVWGIILEGKCECCESWVTIDSCWDIYGYDYAKNSWNEYFGLEGTELINTEVVLP